MYFDRVLVYYPKNLAIKNGRELKFLKPSSPSGSPVVFLPRWL